MGNWKQLWQIFWTFFKIGPVTFGGGYAMIPLIEREVVEKHKWVTSEEVTDVFAVAESIPGAIAINSATFVGYKIAKTRGAIAAMLGVLLPTFLIVLALCVVFIQVRDNPKVEAAFKGIRAAIVALILFAGYKIGKTAVIDKTTLVTVAATVVFLLVLHPNPVLIIVSGAAVGIILVQIKQWMGISAKLDSHEHNSNMHPDWFMGDGI